MQKIDFEIEVYTYGCDLRDSHKFTYQHDGKDEILHRINFRNSDGHNYSLEFDIEGKQIYLINLNSENDKVEYFYNDNGYLVRVGSKKYGTHFEYDREGNCVHEYSDEYDEWRKYDNNGNVIYAKHASTIADGEEWFEYNTDNQLIYDKDNITGSETWYEYNANGNIIYAKTLGGCSSGETWCTYDDDGNRINQKSIYNINNKLKEFERCYTYNEEGNIVYIFDSLNREVWFEYEARKK